MPRLDLTLVGLRHNVTVATLREISKACPLKVEIKREPENIHDENALAVWCKEKPWRNMKFGYISRQVAAELSPRMDRGKLEFTEAWLTEVDADAGLGEMLVKARKQ